MCVCTIRYLNNSHLIRDPSHLGAGDSVVAIVISWFHRGFIVYPPGYYIHCDSAPSPFIIRLGQIISRHSFSVFLGVLFIEFMIKRCH